MNTRHVQHDGYIGLIRLMPGLPPSLLSRDRWQLVNEMVSLSLTEAVAIAATAGLHPHATPMPEIGPGVHMLRLRGADDVPVYFMVFLSDVPRVVH